jgi:hypothetical protein
VCVFVCAAHLLSSCLTIFEENDFGNNFFDFTTRKFIIPFLISFHYLFIRVQKTRTFMIFFFFQLIFFIRKKLQVHFGELFYCRHLFVSIQTTRRNFFFEKRFFRSLLHFCRGSRVFSLLIVFATRGHSAALSTRKRRRTLNFIN